MNAFSFRFCERKNRRRDSREVWEVRLCKTPLPGLGRQDWIKKSVCIYLRRHAPRVAPHPRRRSFFGNLGLSYIAAGLNLAEFLKLPPNRPPKIGGNRTHERHETKARSTTRPARERAAQPPKKENVAPRTATVTAREAAPPNSGEILASQRHSNKTGGRRKGGGSPGIGGPARLTAREDRRRQEPRR